MKPEIRTETFQMDQPTTEAGTHIPEGYRVLVFIVQETGAKKRWFKVLYMNTDEKIIGIAFRVERRE